MTVEKARKLIGWTQSRLAREAKQSVSTIRDIEIGHYQRPSFALVMAVVEALRRGGLPGLQPEDLFSDGSPSASPTGDAA